MKKTIWIALTCFTLGLITAGFVLLSPPSNGVVGHTAENTAFPSTNLYAQETPRINPGLDFTTIVDRVGPAVVKVVAERIEKRQSRNMFDNSPFDDFWRRFFDSPGGGQDEEYRAFPQGTGFLISADGYVLTNNHIVENAVKVTIGTIEDMEYNAEIIGTDKLTDLALLRVKGENFPFITLGDSDMLRVGEWVLAIGNPWGLEHTVTAGIVSAKARQLQLDDPNAYQDFIQTDAAINQGNSGGPLVNLKGEAVGINSIIYSATGGNIGIGFSISANLAKSVVRSLKENGRVIRSIIGVGIYPITKQYQDALGIPTRKGAIVGSVTAGGPAEKAGLKRYDVITKLNGLPVDDRTDLRFKIADIKPGTTIELTILRKEDKKFAEKIFKIKLKELESGEVKEDDESSKTDLGFSVDGMTGAIAERLNFEIDKGLIVTDVTNYSVAQRAGLRKYDVILEINQQELNSVKELEKILKAAKSGDTLLLLVHREYRNTQSDEFFITLRIPE
ncbi:MAG: Do family serine endopeptidase [Acidobacteria bacterium]|nr:Do family serine endopeptidase [Acidobacteriota bacterium]